VSNEHRTEDGKLSEVIDYPRDWPELDTLMSNFDHEVDESVAAQLKEVKAVAKYPGWEFSATCWWDGERGQYLAAVRRYCSLRATYAAATPQGLMRLICEDYGND